MTESTRSEINERYEQKLRNAGIVKTTFRLPSTARIRLSKLALKLNTSENDVAIRAIEAFMKEIP